MNYNKKNIIKHHQQDPPGREYPEQLAPRKHNPPIRRQRDQRQVLKRTWNNPCKQCRQSIGKNHKRESEEGSKNNRRPSRRNPRQRNSGPPHRTQTNHK